MVHLYLSNIEGIKKAHADAVEDFVSHRPAPEQDKLYSNINQILSLPSTSRPIDNYSWLRDFILAEVDTLEHWVLTIPKKLNFNFFRELYKKRFSTIDKYVDNVGIYNAYVMLGMMDIKVCPYCDDEYFDILHPEQGQRRTSDIDHFYPEGEFPALAMCFYNLIPSGKCCNQVMNKYHIEANPYHPQIENWSRFESNLPIGANLDSLTVEDFSVTLKTMGRMMENNKKLALEEKYNKRKDIIRKFLIGARDYSDSKIGEYQRLGLPLDWILLQKSQILGNPYPCDRGKTLHQKLKYDLTGY